MVACPDCWRRLPFSVRYAIGRARQERHLEALDEFIREALAWFRKHPIPPEPHPATVAVNASLNRPTR
jgi:hypothetical protein